MKRVVIIEDDHSLAELLQMNVNSIPNHMCSATFENPLDFLTENVYCDIILLDLITPKLGGLEAIDKILKKLPDVLIIINSIKDDAETIFKALQLGAIGYIDKQSFDLNFKEVFNAIDDDGAYMTPKIARKVINYFNSGHKVKVNLTNRESDIVAGILDGLPYKLIADKHEISINTVRMNIKNIYKKLNINSKSELFIKMGYTNYID
jgi:DNA-binding NarL/FixJ family response regulator